VAVVAKVFAFERRLTIATLYCIVSAALRDALASLAFRFVDIDRVRLKLVRPKGVVGSGRYVNRLRESGRE
jgi:hypothetical protein